MKGENLLKLSKMLTPRGLGVKISKNPILKKELYNLTSTAEYHRKRIETSLLLYRGFC
ncbi:hypothetical protein [Persephonella sp.]